MSRQDASTAASSGTAQCTGARLDESAPAGVRIHVLQVPAELASLAVVEKMIECLCEQSIIEPVKSDAIVLSVSEAMSNALRHGSLCGAAASIRIECLGNDTMLKVCVIDSGLELPDSVTARYREHTVDMPESTALAEALPEGGWGINLILHGTSEVSYRRVAGLNHLTLTFCLKA